MAIMSIEDLRQVLKDSPALNDVVAFVEGQVDAERNKGVEAHRKVTKEAQSLRRFKQALESAGYEGDAEQVDEWLQSMKKTPAKPDGQVDPEIEKLRKEFLKAQKALEEEKANVSKIKQSSDRKTMKAKIAEALRDKVYGHDLLADSLIGEGRVKLLEGDEVVFVDGDNEVEFGAGMKKLLESRPDLLKNTQAPGARSGTRPQGGKPTYTIDQLKSMSTQEIAANMNEIMSSLKASKA